MHLNTKFGSKMLGSVEDIIWTNTDILTLHCDLDLECSDPSFFLFLQNTWAYDHVTQDQVWLPRNQQFRRYNRKSHILITWALAVTLTLQIANNFFPLHDTLAHDAASHNKFEQNVLWFRRYHPDKYSLTFWPLTVTLALNAVIQLFIFTAHSGLQWCIIRPSLVAKESTVQKIW